MTTLLSVSFLLSADKSITSFFTGGSKRVTDTAYDDNDNDDYDNDNHDGNKMMRSRCHVFEPLLGRTLRCIVHLSMLELITKYNRNNKDDDGNMTESQS